MYRCALIIVRAAQISDYTVRKFMLNLTRFTCSKQSTQIIMLI